MLYSIIDPIQSEMHPAYDPIKTHVFCTFSTGWLISLVVIQVHNPITSLFSYSFQKGICILGALFFSWAHFHLHHVYKELISTLLLLIGAGFTIAVLAASDHRADYALWLICLSQIISLALPQCKTKFKRVYVNIEMHSYYDLSIYLIHGKHFYDFISIH